MDFPTVRYFSRLHPLEDELYKNALSKLKEDSEKATNEVEKQKIFETFANNYTVIPDLWKYQIQHLARQNVDFHELLNRSFTHFYSFVVFNEAKKLCNKCYKNSHQLCYFAKSYDYIQKCITPENTLLSPNHRVKEQFKLMDEFSKRPIPANVLKKYKKVEAFAARLAKIEESNYEEWIETIFEWEDKKFVFQSIECKLALNYENKNFWKVYIDGVKPHNVKIMLNIYHRYTRFFLSDIEMKEKYENEIENAAKDKQKIDALPDLKSYLFDANILPSDCRQYFSTTKAHRQTYSLTTTIISYVLENSNSSVRSKLFNCCKKMFSQKPTPICHRLKVKSKCKKSKYSFQSIKIKNINEQQNLNILSNLYISNSLEIQYPSIKMLHIIIPKLHKCEARFIFIKQQVITFQEFRFLINKDRIEKFVFFNGGITKNENDDDAVASLKDILQTLSNAYDIRIQFNQKFELSPDFMISTIERKIKLKIFEIGYLNSLFDIDDYCDFVLKHASSEAKFTLKYANNVSKEDANDFHSAVNKFASTNINHKFNQNFEVGYPIDFTTEYLSIFNSPNMFLLLSKDKIGEVEIGGVF